MGLLDTLRLAGGRPKAPGPALPDPEIYRRVGRLEAECERLDLSWVAYRDELRRLVARLEKRDQRAQERETREQEGSDKAEGPDAITAKVWARRNRNRGA